MSTTYSVRPGDTFASIARRQYGSEQYARLVAQANPGASEPLQVGASIVTPPAPAGLPARIAPASAAGLNEVALLIKGEVFRFWTEITVNTALDEMATVEFSAPFDSENVAFRNAFRPFTFAPVVVLVGGQPQFTGTMLTPTPSVTPDGVTVAVSCYSQPGVLDDCTAPASAFPLEFNRQALPDIAAALCSPFGLAVVADGTPGPAFERVALEPGANVLQFLADLARQRSLVMTSTPLGALQFPSVVRPGRPVAQLREGESPLLSVSPEFSPQDYYSHVTGLEPVSVGTFGSQFTVKNPHLLTAVRPLTFKGDDTEGGDVATATQAKAGRMFGNMVTYTVELATWRDPQGALWAPNTTLTLLAPSAMVYSPYEFIVRRVSLRKNGDSEVATLQLVLPGSFSGEIPERLPWQE